MRVEQQEKLRPGCYFDCARGIYIGRDVQKLAIALGWTGESILDPEQLFYSEAEEEATAYLEQFAPAGFWLGYTEHGGDWGVWEEGE